MKFLRFSVKEKEYIGYTQDEKTVTTIDCEDMISLIKKLGTDDLPEFSKGEDFNMSDITFMSPIVKPIHDVICVGVNYRDHREESKSQNHVKESVNTVYFSKRATKIYAHNEDLPDLSVYDNSFDYELELAVVIGKDCLNVKAEDAEKYIFGYSIFNDGSIRKIQTRHQQWFKGKGFDGASVMGPYIVHKSEIAYPPVLDVVSFVNGEQRQKSNTALFIKNISEIIEEFSAGTTLEAGDIIITGTPAGVGMGFDPPKYLKSGDELEFRIEKIGVLKNRIK
ncbi:MAG: fumarylacetoacetate hydrolase family protein [Clostridia bacterium]